ncbi:SIMPL domain-containing protein [Algoriphagus halophytocola]|uniref:SIMPL domain-containing protein n=1 Tax=Algoriphagus halophytocola TaxID=2991499 RepID=A0ABY6MLY0_9BACT|nr:MULTISPECIES: SIMPL domain-containing protein [unclassified Algoriphagus]UZD24145.1 SIMPL domain-containing protein [Algoriphagus sp. TR-M5]WBL41516.1 SIMPL domain-containing protein [Algoriphagus sp. TR-M9]
MKNYLTLILAIAFFAPALAQDDMSVPLIEVEGYSERKIAPDEANFQINLEEKAMKVPDAVQVLNKKTERLAQALKKAKIQDYKLIADNYSVNVNRIYRSGSSKDSGYVARQTLRVVTSSKNEDLQKIVEAIQNAGDMSYNLSFQVSETTEKSLQDEMLREALKDAERKAKLISETLGIRSIQVHRVSLEAQPVTYPKMEMMRAQADGAAAPPMLNPDDQRLQKRVVVKYTY